MNYKEFIEFVGKNKIEPLGQIVWVTDVRMSDGEALIRNIRAEKMIVVTAEEAGRSHYSLPFALQKIGKSGQPIKQYASFYDNTRYGPSVNIYYNEHEAKEKLAEQLKVIAEYYERKISEYSKTLKELNDEMQALEK